MPNILENGLADNSLLVDLAYETLLKEYQKDSLKAIYEQAFKNYKVEKVRSKDENYDRYFIVFLDTKIALNSWSFDYMKPEEREVEIDRIYKRSRLCKLLNN